jgi:hypothetical protein
MKRKSLEQVSCPVAQSLERVGDQWSMLIMRDALNGCRRFDEFQKSLDGKAVVMVDTETGMEAEPVVIDSVSGLRLDHPRFRSSAELKRQADALLPDP